VFAKKVFNTMKTSRWLIRDFILSAFLRIVLVIGKITKKWEQNNKLNAIQHIAKALAHPEINSCDGYYQENAPGIGFLEQFQTQMFLGGHATEDSVRGEFNASEY